MISTQLPGGTPMSLNVDKETLAVAGLLWGDGITIMSKLSPRKVKI